MRKIVFTNALVNLIAGCIFDGLTDAETALLAGVSSKTIQRARSGDICPRIKQITLEQLRVYIEKIRDGDDRTNHWQRIAWFLERRYPDRWAKPEVLLNVNAGTNVTNNTMVITAEQASSLRSRTSAIDAELAVLTPPSRRNSQGSDKFSPVLEGEQRIANAQSNSSDKLISHNSIEKGLQSREVRARESTLTEAERALTSAHPATPTPAGAQRESATPLSGKFQISELSSNSKEIRKGRVKGPRKKEEILKEALRKAALHKKKARGRKST